MIRTAPFARFAIAAGLLAAAAVAAPPKVPPATPAGKPVDCVQIANIRETRVRDDRTIDFFMRSGEVYRNTLPYACPELGFEQSFSYQTSLSQLCAIDTITVLRQTGGITPGATCGLGKFQPVTGLR